MRTHFGQPAKAARFACAIGLYRRRAAAFPRLLLTAVQHAPTVRGWSRRALHPLPAQVGAWQLPFLVYY